HDQRRRLPVAEELLELRIKLEIRAVVVEEIELDLDVAGTIEQRLILEPGARIDTRTIRDAIEILRAHGCERSACTQDIALCLLTTGPVRFDRFPEFPEPLFVRVAVLNHECGDALGMLERDAIADGRAVVHDI